MTNEVGTGPANSRAGHGGGIGEVGTRRRASARFVAVAGVAVAALGTAALTIPAWSAGIGAAGPTALAVSRSGTTARITWTTGPEKSDVVQRATSASGPFAAVGSPHRVRREGRTLGVRDNALDPAKPYWYRVVGTVGTQVVASAVVEAQAITLPAPVPGGTSPVARWWKDFGTPSIEQASGVATDAAGHITIAALITNKVDFGNGVSAGADRMTTGALVQYNADGTARWARDITGTFASVAVDHATGDIVTAGRFGGTVDFGGISVSAQAPAGSQDSFIARYANDGTARAVRDVNIASGWTLPSAVGVAADGTALVTGYGKQISSASARSIFIATLPPTGAGTTKWLTPSVDGGGLSIAGGPNGEIVVSGFFAGTLDVNGVHLQSAGGSGDVFVASFPASGTGWVKSFGDVNEDRGTAVTVAPNGDVVLAGYFAGTVKIGTISLTNPIGNYGGTLVPEPDVFLARFTATGAVVWAHNYTPPQPDGNGAVPYAVATDAAGNIALGGELVNNIDFGNGPLVGNHSLDAFIARFNATGQAVWSGRYGGTFDDRVLGVAFDPGDGVVAGGSFNTTIGTLTSAGINDGFVVSFAP